MFGKYSILFILINFSTFSVCAQQFFPAIEQTQLQRQEQHEAALQQQMQSGREVRFETPPSNTQTLPHHESPCFPIQEVQPGGEASETFAFALRQTLAKTH